MSMNPFYANVAEYAAMKGISYAAALLHTQRGNYLDMVSEIRQKKMTAANCLTCSDCCRVVGTFRPFCIAHKREVSRADGACTNFMPAPSFLTRFDSGLRRRATDKRELQSA